MWPHELVVSTKTCKQRQRHVILHFGLCPCHSFPSRLGTSRRYRSFQPSPWASLNYCTKKGGVLSPAVVWISYTLKGSFSCARLPLMMITTFQLKPKTNFRLHFPWPYTYWNRKEYCSIKQNLSKYFMLKLVLLTLRLICMSSFYAVIQFDEE